MSDSKGVVEAQAVAVRKFDIARPDELIKMAKVLKHHIVKNKLYEEIETSGGKKNYVLVEGWQFAGGLLGVNAVVVEEQEIGNKTEKETKWKVRVELRHGFGENAVVVGRGVAICSSKEEVYSRKLGKKIQKWNDEYAILSMAQTRAVGKAYRLLLAWIMKAAGYETTPAEDTVIDIEEVAEVKDATAKTEKKEKKASNKEEFKLLKKSVAEGKFKRPALEAQLKQFESGAMDTKFNKTQRAALVREITKALAKA